MGGGFGAKQDLFQTEFLCALLAQQTRRPVRMEYTREETFLGGRTRHPVKIWLKQGFRKDGTLTARAGAHRLQLRRLRLARAGRDHRRHQRADLAVPLRERAARRPLRLHQQPDRRRLPRLRRGADLLRARHPDGRGGREARHRPGRAQAEERGARGRHRAVEPSADRPRPARTASAAASRRSDWAALRRRARDTPRAPQRRGWGMGCEMHGSERLPRHQGAGQRHRQDERGRHGRAADRHRGPRHRRAHRARADRGRGARRALRDVSVDARRHRRRALGHRRLRQPHHLHGRHGGADGGGRRSSSSCSSAPPTLLEAAPDDLEVRRRDDLDRARHRAQHQRARRGGARARAAGRAVRRHAPPTTRPSRTRSRRTSSRSTSTPRPGRSTCCRSCRCTRSAR